jgi:PAS domain S-box-containing protein
LKRLRVTKTGKRVNVSLTISPIEDSIGRIVGVSGVARDITARKHAEQALHESEERFRLAAQAGKMFAYEWDAATDKIARSEGVTRILGVDAGANTTGQEILTMVPPEDRAKLIAAIAQLSPEEPHLRISYRMVRSDGNVIWVERTSRAYFDEQGKMLRIVGMIADITERKLAETALAEVSHKLLQAQEKERNRIGRELHDDINQRLATMSVELQQLHGHPFEFQERVQHLQQEMAEISNDVQALSHELHPSKLEYLGFVAGMKSWCKEFGERQRIEVNFKTDIVTRIPSEIGVTLLRISQEALHNAVKHSGVRRVEVQLSERSNEIYLTISDTGKGFDMETVRQGRGLGLISMEERVRLVNGTIEIQSKPMGGTTVHVHVPFEPEHKPQRAAG